METISKLLDLLSPAERKRAGVLMAMMLVMALLDMLGVASILPFIAVLANPALVETNPILSWAYQLSANVGVASVQQFLFLLGFLVFALLVFSLTFKALTTYAQTRFALMREYSIGKRLVEGYLHQPYSWFLNRHSADLGKNILSEVGGVIGGSLLPVMTLFTQTAVTVSILGLLLVVDPWLAILVGLVLSIAYGGILALMSGWLNTLGQARIQANKERYTVLSEAFGAVKEVKVGGLEAIFIERFAKPAEKYAKGQATAQVIAQIPRFALEAIAFGGMLLVILYLMAQSGSFATALPVIALYAFAGYRLMPALQQIYGAFTQLKYAGPALRALHTDLMGLNAVEPYGGVLEPLPLNKCIELNNIVYQYPNANAASLNGINLSISARSTVGFVGSTGSGKTTAVDLILGLLEPQEGTLCIDGQVVNASNRRQWQKSIGYVPQHIYLADDTISANIAFGLAPEIVDQEAVKRAAKIANLHDFVVENMPDGYNTKVGERGVRLSGGQRQRIGIARALYHNPNILVMDEATSALDNLTEQAVMEAVYNLSQSITIILIAHRLSTVKTCDTLFLLENGELKAKGTFKGLTQINEQFRAMVANH
jgi:ABC-type multidrug transport system fused ATPase/permease subunit